MSSIIESVGDYIATAHICEQPRPPIHAINRGIAIEGLGSIIAALTGVCHSTTTWSNMIGLISYTGVNGPSQICFRFFSCCIRTLHNTRLKRWCVLQRCTLCCLPSFYKTLTCRKTWDAVGLPAIYSAVLSRAVCSKRNDWKRETRTKILIVS